MSTMIKKKGALAFKPKAPGARRPGAPLPTASSGRPSVEPQSQTAAPTSRPAQAVSPPLVPASLPIMNEKSPPDRGEISQLQDNPITPPTEYPPPKPISTVDTASIPISKSIPTTAPIPEQHVPPPKHISLPKPIQETQFPETQILHGEESTIQLTPAATPTQDDTSSLAVQLSIIQTTSLATPKATTPNGIFTISTPPPPIPQQDTSPSITQLTVVQKTSVETAAVAAPRMVSVTATSTVGTGEDLSTLGAGESLQPSQIVPVASLNLDGTSGASLTPKPITKAKVPTKRRKLNPNEINSSVDVRPTIEVQVNRPRRAPAPAGPKLPRKPRKESVRKHKPRVGTPSDAEDQEIDHTTITMAELTKDLRIGRKFSKHAEIRQREVEQKAKAKLARDFPGLNPVGDDRAENANQSGLLSQPQEAFESLDGPQMRLVDGQIVIDDRSLVVDRHRVAAAEAMEMEEVEENDFTRVTTSGTLMKRVQNISWGLDDEEKFYNGLRMFGTDFEMISKMFPNRNRRQIKLKFNKEERTCPKKITAALIGEKIEIDMDEYKSHTGLEYEAVADINAEYNRLEEEHNAEQRQHEAQAEETIRQKKAAIQSKGAPGARTSVGTPATGTESAKENDFEAGRGGANAEGGKASAASKLKRKAPARKRKNLHSAQGGGEEVEVLGNI